MFVREIKLRAEPPIEILLYYKTERALEAALNGSLVAGCEQVVLQDDYRQSVRFSMKDVICNHVYAIESLVEAKAEIKYLDVKAQMQVDELVKGDKKLVQFLIQKMMEQRMMQGAQPQPLVPQPETANDEAGSPR